MTRRIWTEADYARMHADGLAPATVYGRGCRCPACLAYGRRKVDAQRERRQAARDAERLDAEVVRLVDAAMRPIVRMPIHGVGLVTVGADGSTTVEEERC